MDIYFFQICFFWNYENWREKKSGKDKSLREELPELKGTNDEIFYLDEGFRITPVKHNIKGRQDLKTLGFAFNSFNSMLT